jgi:hypothetical protein
MISDGLFRLTDLCQRSKKAPPIEIAAMAEITAASRSCSPIYRFAPAASNRCSRVIVSCPARTVLVGDVVV